MKNQRQLLLVLFFVLLGVANGNRPFKDTSLYKTVLRIASLPTLQKQMDVPSLVLRNKQGLQCPYQPTPMEFNGTLPYQIQNAINELESTFKSMLYNETHAPSMFGIAAYKNEIIWQWGIGSKDLKHPGVPPNENTIFRIASISKLFPVLMLYQLSQKGIVALDDPVDKYVNFSIVNPFVVGSPSITFREMASHSSGLPREAPCSIPCNVTTDEILARLSNFTLLFPPYTVPSYSNLGFALLGRVLESIVGTTYEDYVRKYILRPLNLMSTGFKISGDVVSRMAVGYEPDGSVAPLTDLGWESPAGQMYSTGADLARLMFLFLNSIDMEMLNAIGISQANLKEMLLPVFLNSDGTTMFCMPWETELKQSYLVRTKSGNIDGYSSVVSVVPELQLGVTLLWNGAALERNFIDVAYET
jgi:CubicO group peptidase (beta-lactamase class C family)